MKRKRTSSLLFGLVPDSEGRKQILERESNFSLDFLTFGPLVLVGARGEVGLRCKGYAWTPVLWSFNNSRSGVFLLLGYSLFKKP